MINSIIYHGLQQVFKERPDPSVGICDNLKHIIAKMVPVDVFKDTEDLITNTLYDCFSDMRLNRVFPVEGQVEGCNQSLKLYPGNLYHRYIDKWDITTNPYALIRWKLLDDTISYFEGKRNV